MNLPAILTSRRRQELNISLMRACLCLSAQLKGAGLQRNDILMHTIIQLLAYVKMCHKKRSVPTFFTCPQTFYRAQYNIYYDVDLHYRISHEGLLCTRLDIHLVCIESIASIGSVATQ